MALPPYDRLARNLASARARRRASLDVGQGGLAGCGGLRRRCGFERRKAPGLAAAEPVLELPGQLAGLLEVREAGPDTAACRLERGLVAVIVSVGSRNSADAQLMIVTPVTVGRPARMPVDLRTRSLARCLFPLPEERALFQGRLLVYGSMLLGPVYGTSQVLGSYIIHKDNVSYNPVWAEMCYKRGQIMENFLNDTLQKMNKKRIASFYDSPRAQLYYNERGRTKGLLKLAYKIPARCFCLETIWFSLQILWYCFKLVVGIKKRPWHTLKQKMLVKTKRFN